MPMVGTLIPGTKWTILSPAPDYISPKSGKRATRSLCRCECGDQYAVSNVKLLHASSRQCINCSKTDPARNCVPCCTNCNTKKNALSVRDIEKLFLITKQYSNDTDAANSDNFAVAANNKLSRGFELKW